MMDEERIAILLATYNGAKYISSQIESVLDQTYKKIDLFISDDGSTDGTMDIIKKYEIEYNQICVIPNDNPGKGAALNFGFLMQEVNRLYNYKYVMFCDQDDIWNTNKVQLSLSAIIKLEEGSSPKNPILVHTDFQYVDRELQPLVTNVNVARKLSKLEHKIKVIANDNYIFGCTIIINQSLLKLSLPVPQTAENHDYWIALHAATFGTISYLDTKTMNYRQHEKNVTGGIAYSTFSSRIKRVFKMRIYIFQKNRRLLQFETFFIKVNKSLPPKSKKLFQDYLLLSLKGGFISMFLIMIKGFKMRGIGQTIFYYLSLFLDRHVKLTDFKTTR
jgi:glycosyltransferase involved in cell wall biosynthesis